MRVFRKVLEGFRRKNQIETFMPNNFDFSYTSPSSIFSPLPSSFVGDNLSFFLSTRMATTIQGNVATTVDQKKRALRMKIRKDLKSMPLSHRRQEDELIQSIILNSSWLGPCKSLCAYISSEDLREVDTSRILSQVISNLDGKHAKKKLYVPRVEDRNSNMRMLHISTMEDLIENSMNILEPSPVDAHGNPREDVMQTSDPVDVFLLPGLAFDCSGRRIGRGGGYYDVFLRKYQELVSQRKWKKPLLVSLAYSVQIMDEGVIPITQDDFPVDAIVCPSGVIQVDPAIERK
ncbi:putative 5-formyltetrahydrofolate cyclo-ligase [Zostera marina]|uniref:5-formyltetrahydrofolate cyclo-ligase n=1 Tax=Zostera marina TaxID=29655 RepID=A0A0K9NWV1_ZOSMR|nr:putative 5-formyltetrahydrofolate cyclo-ligase [Zostera marina]